MSDRQLLNASCASGAVDPPGLPNDVSADERALFSSLSR